MSCWLDSGCELLQSWMCRFEMVLKVVIQVHFVSESDLPDGQVSYLVSFDLLAMKCRSVDWHALFNEQIAGPEPEPQPQFLHHFP